jgi:trk system potassium uptake protein TrkH
VILLGLSALTMLVPALHANIVGDFATSRAFLYAGLLVGVLVTLLALALANRSPRDVTRSQFRALILAYVLLPPVLAIPFSWAVPDTRFFNVWFEMVSSFTTTGATLYGVPGRLPESVHLWRGLVGWLGGFFTLVTAAAILAPMNLGGFEVLAPRSVGRVVHGVGQVSRQSDPSDRLTHYAALLFPVYASLTLGLWVALALAGEPGLVAAMHAMAVLSTSGITPQAGQGALNSGMMAEVILALGLCLALTRRSLPGLRGLEIGPIWRDAELRLATLFLTAVPLFLVVRHWVGAVESETVDDLASALVAFWGAAFTVLSFLTTTGFESQYWQAARVWSGLEAPGLLLLGLAIMGGGVATTAGGVKLLRVHALLRLGLREVDRLNYPSAVAGGGATARPSPVRVRPIRPQAPHGPDGPAHPTAKACQTRPRAARQPKGQDPAPMAQAASRPDGPANRSDWKTQSAAAYRSCAPKRPVAQRARPLLKPPPRGLGCGANRGHRPNCHPTVPQSAQCPAGAHRGLEPARQSQ